MRKNGQIITKDAEYGHGFIVQRLQKDTEVQGWIMKLLEGMHRIENGAAVSFSGFLLKEVFSKHCCYVTNTLKSEKDSKML